YLNLFDLKHLSVTNMQRNRKSEGDKHFFTPRQRLLLAAGSRLSVSILRSPVMGVSAALLLLLALSAASRGHELLNEDVKRSVDLSSHIAKVTAEVKTEDEEHGYLEVRKAR
ncbi:unnamed protein product, partial [Ranitomeya imitator]